MPNYILLHLRGAVLVLLRTLDSDREAPNMRFRRAGSNDRLVLDTCAEMMRRFRLVDARSSTHAASTERSIPHRRESGHDYPIKTMNVRKDPANFQVDTGPILVPRWDAGDRPAALRFDVAHVVYWKRDRAEFVLRRPMTVGSSEDGPVQVTDYSELRFDNATNSILAEII